VAVADARDAAAVGEPVFDREDVQAIFGALFDIRGLLVQILERLGEDGEEEEDES
jgi:hypothetical protein